MKAHRNAAMASPATAEVLAQQYAVQAVAADWFRAQVAQRWAAAYLDKRGLTEPATAALAGYAPSRPGQWTLLTDHLRSLGYTDDVIETAGLATRSRRGELIDRYRDRVMLPVLDAANRPIGFLGRKPAGDTNPDNPKYLNPTSTPLYDKSRVLYGQDAEAIAKLHNGARAIIVEGPMDRLAIQLAADQTGMDLVPVATCGSALTDAHLDLLAQHTALDHVILGFDADAAGRKASIAAGKKLAARGVATPDVELFTAPAGADPADILANDGAELLAATLTDPQHHATLLELLVDDQLDQYDWSSSGFPLRELPIASHAAHQATRLVADTVRERVTWGPAYAEQIQRQLTRIAERTGIDAAELNNHMIGVAFPDDYDGDAVAELDRAAAAGIDLAVHGAEPELELRSDVGGEYQIEEVADADADRF